MKITWVPRTNTQRSAINRFKGTDWEFTSGNGSQIFSGEKCRMINPIGFRQESRWVPTSQISKKQGLNQ